MNLRPTVCGRDGGRMSHYSESLLLWYTMTGTKSRKARENHFDQNATTKSRKPIITNSQSLNLNTVHLQFTEGAP